MKTFKEFLNGSQLNEVTDLSNKDAYSLGAEIKAVDNKGVITLSYSDTYSRDNSIKKLISMGINKSDINKSSKLSGLKFPFEVYVSK